MRKILLGRTGLAISELAFGGGVTGGILINPDEATRYNALQRAVSAGINWIDTAPVYGNGASEETIGRHLEALSPQPHVSTKVRLEAGDMHDIAGAIERSLEHSLWRLRSGRVTLFQLHNHLGTGVGERIALTPEHVLDRGGVADTFDRLKEQGLIRSERHDRGRRYRSLPRGDQQRPLRCRPGLLQRHQSERRLAALARGMAGRAGPLRHPGRMLPARTWAC